MSDAKFEWQADGDENLIGVPGSGKRQEKRRRLWLSVSVFILISTFCLVAVRYFSQQQRRLEGEMRQDVANSFDLWERAIEARDTELYTYLLGGGDRDWQWKQRALFEKGLILQRAFLGLTVDDEGHSAPEVNLSPDWRQATVTFEQQYGTGPVSEFDGTVRLHTAMFMKQIASGEEQVIFDDRDLAQAAGVDDDSLSLRFVIANPADLQMLLVQALGFRDHAGEYFLFSVRLPGDELTAAVPEIVLRVRRRGLLVGDTSLIVSSGYLPFSPSPDGRWLLISELSGYDPAARTFLLHDLQANKTRIVSEDETVMPAQFPSYDWSDDGRWLVITGNGFIRLLAPADDYEQLVPHDFDSCGLVRWSE